jgi:hypothetical protein
MHGKLRRPALWIGLALAPILALTAGREAVHLLGTQASLQPGPGSGPPSGLLAAGTPVTVMERQGDWLKVRVEGWIPVDALPPLHAEAAAVPPMPEEAAEPAETPAATPATPGPAGAAAGGTAAAAGSVAAVPGATLRLEGLISAGSRRLRKISGAGSEVVLIRGSGLEPGDPEADAGAHERLEEIEAEAARLKEKADRALQGDSFASDSFTESSAEYEKTMGQRRRLLAERADILAALHGRHAAEARKRSQASTVADESGFYTFGPLSPGTYTVYARLSREEIDVEWIETVTLVAEPVRLDLTPENGRGFLEQP